jgi:hypothetical protein
MGKACVNVTQWGLVDVFASTYGRCLGVGPAMLRNFNNLTGAECAVGTATKASVCWGGTSENGNHLACQNGKCAPLQSRELVIDGPCWTNLVGPGLCPESSTCIKSGKLGDIVAFPLPNADGRCVAGVPAPKVVPLGPLCAFTPQEHTTDVGCYCEKGGVGKCISSFAGQQFMLNGFFGFVAPAGAPGSGAPVPNVGCWFSAAGNGTAFGFVATREVARGSATERKAFVDECGTVTGLCSVKRGKCSDCHVGDANMRTPAFQIPACPANDNAGVASGACCVPRPGAAAPSTPAITSTSASTSHRLTALCGLLAVLMSVAR